MQKKNLVYIGSLRNAAADNAGQYIPYKNEQRYMRSPLEYLAHILDNTEIGQHYTLVSIIFDDDETLDKDKQKVGNYGFSHQSSQQWFYPTDLSAQGKKLVDLTQSVPSSYRKYPFNSEERTRGKDDFEARLKNKLDDLKADVVLLDGLLVILDKLVRPDSDYYRKIANIHPGITADDSPYQRRGACATLDALYGAKGLKVTDWENMTTIEAKTITKTGASFHYVDNGIDSGEVIADVLNTDIDPEDTILELRWNNFENSLFPAIYKGLLTLTENT